MLYSNAVFKGAYLVDNVSLGHIERVACRSLLILQDLMHFTDYSINEPLVFADYQFGRL
jgi:hypothetical protein